MTEQYFDIFTSERYLDGEIEEHSPVKPFIDGLRAAPTADEFRGEVAVLNAFKAANAHRFSGFWRLASAKVSIAAAVVAFVFTGAVAASVNGVVPKPVHDAASAALAKTSVVSETSIPGNPAVAEVYTWVNPDIGSVRYMVMGDRMEILEVTSADGMTSTIREGEGQSLGVRFSGTGEKTFDWSLGMTPSGVQVTTKSSEL